LSQMNGRLASAYAMLDVGRMQRNITTGGLTSESTSRLVEAVGDLEEKLVPAQAAAMNVMSEAAMKMLEAANAINSALNMFSDLAADKDSTVAKAIGNMAAVDITGFWRLVQNGLGLLKDTRDLAAQEAKMKASQGSFGITKLARDIAAGVYLGRRKPPIPEPGRDKDGRTERDKRTAKTFKM